MKREKAKNQGMKERIAEETADLRKENRDVDGEIRKVLKRGQSAVLLQLPVVFRPVHAGAFRGVSRLPGGGAGLLFGDSLRDLHADSREAAFVSGGNLFSLSSWCSGGIYILLTNRTKARHLETLRDARVMRDHIRSNPKKDPRD